jgi:hypothetical protein
MWVQTAAAAAAAGQGEHSKVRVKWEGLRVTGMGQGLKGWVDWWPLHQQDKGWN